jgi:hypothetical protein
MRPERFLLISLLLLQMIPAAAQYRQAFPLPTPAVPDSLGVNIHFNEPRPGEMEQLAAAGFRWIRQDFAWGGIERTRGQYNFSAYERLMTHLRAQKIRPIFILDYGNDLYEQGSPRTDESRAAFARFAAASVTHFKGQGVLWEMWNEPNIGFWKPRPNVDEYIALALATGKAIRAAAPDEWYIGPGVSGMDFDFMEKCFKAGLLEYWDAVSFHPYRNTLPETAAPDFLHLRDLIERYGPPNKQIPILSSEWGYSEKYPGLNLEKQSWYIARQALSDLANGLVVSIWYDWHDDGIDPKEEEHHFGIVYNDFKPKPTYQSIRTLTETLRDCRYDKRLSLASSSDYCLLFRGASGARLAVWTTDPKPHTLRIPASAGEFQVIDYVGAKSVAKADTGGLPVTLGEAPQYLIPMGRNVLLDRALRWRTLAQHTTIDSPADLQSALHAITSGDWTAQDRGVIAGVVLRSKSGGSSTEIARRGARALGAPVEDVLPVKLLMQQEDVPYSAENPYPMRVTLEWKSGGEISQEILFTSRHPLRIVPQPVVGGHIPVRVENPTGASFSGRIGRVSATRANTSVPLEFKTDQTEQTVSLPVDVRRDGSYRVGVRIERRFPGTDDAGWTTVSASPEVDFRPLESFAAYTLGSIPPERDYRVLPDGDPKVKSTIHVAISEAPRGLADPHTRAVRIDYDFDKGWKFLRLEVENEKRAPLPGTPYAIGAWVHGDGSGDVLNARFTDSTGQTFQPTAGRIDWRGWHFVSFSLKGDNSGHWSGANDGIVHYPIHLDTLLLVDSPGDRGGKGTIYASGFTLMGN